MLVNAIEKVSLFTKAMHTVSRTYGGIISPGSATLFFVNEYGDALTCKHVADTIVSADKINAAFESFKQEKNRLPRDNNYKRNLTELERKYNMTENTTMQVKHNFIECVDSVSKLECTVHPDLDLAILKFHGFNRLLVNSFACFVKDSSKIKQGRYTCRLGFPFPEFNNFRYNEQKEDLEWTNDGNRQTPIFPIDGIITRFVADNNAYGEPQVSGIEISTPGLRGQSGGPLFDTDGLVYGMQSMTGHLHLGFDIKDMELVQEGKKTKVSNFPFLHVGRCIHVDRIKEFLKENNIRFYEA